MAFQLLFYFINKKWWMPLEVNFYRNQKSVNKVSEQESGVTYSTDSSTSKPKFANETVALLYHNAKVLFNFNDYYDALVLLRESLNLDSFNVTLMDFCRKTLNQIGLHEESQRLLEISQRVSYSPEKSVELARMYVANEQNDQALAQLFDVLSQLVSDEALLFETYKNIGCVYLKEKEFDLAEEYFHKAFAITPSDDSLLVNLGVLEYLKKDVSKSLSYLREAINNNQKNDKAWVGLAMAHLEFGDNDLSWSNLTKAIDVNPMNRTALILLNDLAETDSQLEYCQNALIQFLETENFDEQISHLLIHVFIKRNDFQRAQLESLKSYLWNPESTKNQELYNKITQFIFVKEKGTYNDSISSK
jgi:tetratricopeptide (TPR) repeat protein